MTEPGSVQETDMRKTYIGPGHEASMKLKRAYSDLSAELSRCRPLGPDYQRIERVLGELNACHVDLFGKPVKEPAQPFQAQPRPDQIRA